MNTIYKHAEIKVSPSYPIISAYDFEFLKQETEIQDILSNSSLYMLIQRPLLVFDKMEVDNESGCLHFEIKDCTNNKPLTITLNPNQDSITKNIEFTSFAINFSFFTKDPQTTQPLTDVPAFKILNEKHDFMAWFSPYKLLFDIFRGVIKAEIEGDVKLYINYNILYIGKSFDMDVWKRLTGHHKFQKILTLEDSICSFGKKNSYEISILPLHVKGYSEINSFKEVVKPANGSLSISHTANNDEELSQYLSPFVDANSLNLTNEAEAYLVQKFKPQYNEILFDNYPNIRTGMREAGYNTSEVTIEDLVAKLETKNDTYDYFAT